MKILVTGSNGQLGSELKEISGDFPEWHFIFTDVDDLDITDEKSVDAFFRKNKPSFIVNCAAYTAVDKSESDMQAAHQINAVGPGVLAMASKKHDVNLIHISTDYVYDGQNYKPYEEFDPVNPASVYGKTKLAGERLIRSANPDTVIIRTAWLYSSFGNNFVKTMLRLGSEKDSLKVVFDQIGTPTYAYDLAQAILEVIANSNNNPSNSLSGIYHYSNDGVASWYDFAVTIFEITGLHCKVLPVLTSEFPTPAKRPHYSVLNKSKIKTTFNIEIPYWKDSLKLCIEKIQKTNEYGK
ncbi:MAG TPA: dTDP-4-dehydrorhamnose reductase [Mariniphaga sp.]|nr:dTDP-4-dehydrorhamnose reductase [Mariniphaga sp.]